MGVHSKITPEITKKIAGYIKSGNYPEVAASLAGIDRSTFYRWIKKGNNAKSGLHKIFCDSIKEAEDYAEAAAVERVRKAGDENWTALAWWLERKHPKKWSRKQQIDLEHSGEIKQKVTSNDSLLNDPDYIQAKAKVMDEYYASKRKAK